MSLFDSAEEHRPSKIRRYIITIVAGVVILFLALWYGLGLRFYKEDGTIHHFMNTVVAGNFPEAYKIWKPEPSYSLKDFQDDWGESGYYGPVHSYKVMHIGQEHNSSAAVITVEVSPYSPFPQENDIVKQSKTKEIKLWVQFSDQSISFPPF
ncbi:MAG TPA: hypothetical protein VMJ93_06370 [Verrucomicrobiae bacterium]|nr:hypothetical protein [Verrucomicrobiae bacterium]